ncbi:unnamed protein product [Symbiodinium sp. KB8]|nr:unnamed protein product [Symbiodinium sp. KB8]
MRRLCCSYIALLLHAGALRPQNDDRREADPDKDGEWVDPVDLDSPVTPKLPPFQVQLTLGYQRILTIDCLAHADPSHMIQAALKKEDGSLLGDLIYMFMPQSDGLDALASAIVRDLPPLLEKEGLKCILAKDGSEGHDIRLMVEITGYKLKDILASQTSEARDVQ